MLFICFLLLPILGQELCQPYGPRLSLGYYYTEVKKLINSQSMIEISFNTNFTCDASLILSYQNQNTSVQVTETVLLNMSEIYANDINVNYTYFTYIQRVELGNLIEGEQYQYYILGNTSEILGPFTFHVPIRDISVSSQAPQRVVFFGDMDSYWSYPNRSAPTFNWFQEQAATNATSYDVLAFVGDMAYDLESEDCSRGDFWLRNITSFMASTWPMQIAPGNHDAGNNTHFSMLRNLFWSPQDIDLNTNDVYLNFYSWNLGLAHFIMFNPYWIVYAKTSIKLYQQLLQAVEEDLVKASVTRSYRPWIIVVSHYPVYCSNREDYMCQGNYKILGQFMDLFQEYSVDFYISGYQHDYERDAPVYQNSVASYDEDENVIIDPQAPVFLIEGAAGTNTEMVQYPCIAEKSFTEFQSVNKTGVGILTILNHTHVYWEHVGTAHNEVIDSIYFAKGINQISGRNPVPWYWIILAVIILVVILGVIVYICHYKKAEEMKEQRKYEMDLNSIINL